MNRQQTEKLMRQGRVSPRAVRKIREQEKTLKFLSEDERKDVADNSRVAGAVGVDHINRNGREWPAVSAVKASNRSWRPKREAPIPNYGDWYSGRSGRP